MHRKLALTCCSVALAGPLAADVLTVGPGPGDDHSTIQAAVDAAADGDSIVVRASPVQGPVTVDGKSLTLIADPGAGFLPLYVEGPWVVQKLGPGQSFAAWGFRIVAGSQQPALALRFDQGAVRMSASRFEGSGSSSALDEGNVGAYVTQCADVTMVDCTAIGGDGFTDFSLNCVDSGNCVDPTDGGAGLRVRNSTVHLFGGACTGGDGGDHYGVMIGQGFGGNGGPGLDDIDGNVCAFGTSLNGGYGGVGDAGDGVIGASAVFGTTQATLTLLGASTPNGVPPGAIDLGPDARRLEAPGPTTAGGTPLVIHGVPGERVFVRYGASGTPPILQYKGGLLPGGGARSVALGTIGANGVLAADVPPPALPAGQIGAAHTLRAFVVTGPLGTLWAGTVPWIVLDPDP